MSWTKRNECEKGVNVKMHLEDKPIKVAKYEGQTYKIQIIKKYIGN